MTGALPIVHGTYLPDEGDHSVDVEVPRCLPHTEEVEPDVFPGHGATLPDEARNTDKSQPTRSKSSRVFFIVLFGLVFGRLRLRRAFFAEDLLAIRVSAGRPIGLKCVRRDTKQAAVSPVALALALELISNGLLVLVLCGPIALEPAIGLLSSRLGFESPLGHDLARRRREIVVVL